MISALPDIKQITITPSDEFMVIACDGIWNYMTSEEVVDFVKKRLDGGQTKISTICEEVIILYTKICVKLMFLIPPFSCSQIVWRQIRVAMVPDAIT